MVQKIVKAKANPLQGPKNTKEVDSHKSKQLEPQSNRLKDLCTLFFKSNIIETYPPCQSYSQIDEN